MPIGALHKRKRFKNLVLLALILGWCAMIWIIAMVRMGTAQAGDLDDVFMEQRQIHRQVLNEERVSWNEDWREKEPERQDYLQEQDAQRARHYQDLISSTAKSSHRSPAGRTP